MQVGQIAAARTLLLTRIHQFRSDRPTVRVHLETKLVDVESGEVLWARELRLGVLPPYAKVLLAALGLGLGLPLVALVVHFGLHTRRRTLVSKKLPHTLAQARDSVEKLERALVQSRARFHAGAADPVQGAFDALQPELLRVRALPGGSAERHRGRDLVAARGPRRADRGLGGGAPPAGGKQFPSRRIGTRPRRGHECPTSAGGRLPETLPLRT